MFDENTKILLNTYLFAFCKARWARRKNKNKNKFTQLKRPKYHINQKTKIWDEQNNRRLISYNPSIKDKTWKNKTEYFTNFSWCYCDGAQDGFVDA